MCGSTDDFRRRFEPDAHLYPLGASTIYFPASGSYRSKVQTSMDFTPPATSSEDELLSGHSEDDASIVSDRDVSSPAPDLETELIATGGLYPRRRKSPVHNVRSHISLGLS